MNDNHGAFAEIDDWKLSRDGLVLLGMRDAYLEVQALLANSRAATDNAAHRHVLDLCLRSVGLREDAIKLRLMQAARQSGALMAMRIIPKGEGN